jgi:hypothetical protein
MPFGDRTGPMGFGAMTGRGAGFCAGFASPDYTNPATGRGFGGQGCSWFARQWAQGPGRGYRWRNWFSATGLPFWARVSPWADQPGVPASGGAAADRDLEIGALRVEAAQLQKTLDRISQRLAQLSEPQHNEEQI